MKSLTNPAGRVIAALFLFASVSACDSGQALEDAPVDPTYDVAQLSSVLVSELDLNMVQQTAVNETASQFSTSDARHPAFLWYLAKRLSENLTPEQIDRFLARSRRMAQLMHQQGMAGPFGMHPNGFGGPEFHGSRPGLGELGAIPGFGFGPRGEPLGAVLTDEQKEALHALRMEHVLVLRELAGALRTADDREAAVAALMEALDAMRAAIYAWLDANLSDEQKALLAEHRAEREAYREQIRAEVHAAIEEVLGPGMADALKAIHDAFVAAVESARDQFDPGSAELHQAVRDAAAERDAAIEALLDEEQLLVFRIHQALQIRASNLGNRRFGSPSDPAGGGQHGFGGFGGTMHQEG